MTTRTFELAPPPKTVDGILAVPIDIQRVTAALEFDGATSTGAGDATVEFTVGPSGGNPIFDLRQTITASWLDGAPFPVAKLAHHDFGGGPQAELRVLESPLAAGSAHVLRVTYGLGPPQASTAGSYLPAIAWSPGPRLTFNFGFTDLGPGRYLEAWVPANLLFDQLELLLDLRLRNTAIPHTVITNGALSATGPSSWRVSFPGRFTAFSPLLELRATDTLASASDTVTLPISGAAVTIEAWKPVAHPADLAAQVAGARARLVANEGAAGPYLHGNRFVLFVNTGGMEYDGGATTGPGALAHEVFHSWWGRGLKPASQPDAWFDEAWTVYNDHGAGEAQPFDFAQPPVTLCPRNAWSRITSGGAYTDGYRFWKGVAALLGPAALVAQMRELYLQRAGGLVTTAEIEAFLLARTGQVALVDAFHRFVYGFGDPAAPADVWLRDHPAHGGEEEWPGPFWDSPDLWIRNRDDGGTAHQPPEYGQDNWFHARVRNRGAGPAHHFAVTFQAKVYAGTEFVFPADFLPCTAAACGFDLAPGESTVVRARWPRALVPPPGTHACLTAAAISAGDHPAPGQHVWAQNDLAQKNLAIVDLKPDEWWAMPFVFARAGRPPGHRYELELVRPARHPALEAILLQRPAGLFGPGTGALRDAATARDPDQDRDCGGPAAGPEPARDAGGGAAGGAVGSPLGPGVEARFPPGARARIPLPGPALAQLVLGLRVRVPTDARAGETLRLDLAQRDAESRRVLGGIALEIRVR